MSKLVKLLTCVALIAGAFALTPGSAQAHHWRHHYSGWSFGFGFGYPYAYYPPPPVYYAPAPYCQWVRVRVWRYDHWSWRRVRRCW